MQFKFTIQPYQTAAADAVASVFAGQPCQAPFEYVRDLGSGRADRTGTLSLVDQMTDDAGYANAPVRLSEAELLDNVRAQQRRFSVPESFSLAKGPGVVALDVEMETGTGKTYVYTKTIFELNHLLGTDGYVRLVEIRVSASHAPRDVVEFNVLRAGGAVGRQTKAFDEGDDLFAASTGLAAYRDGYVIAPGGIVPAQGGMPGYVRFMNDVVVFEGGSEGDSAEANLRRFDASEVHRGYFSVDKKGRAVNSKVARGGEGSDDESAYDLILRDKERLLSFDEPCRFVFSHSALAEGWDNPNVFQICMLREVHKDEAKRRQVGRGLRLCVDQQGVRQDAGVLGEDEVQRVNQLTVVASEGYASFVGDLQKETVERLRAWPRVVDAKLFCDLRWQTPGGPVVEFDAHEAQLINNVLVKHGLVDMRGRPTEKFREEGLGMTPALAVLCQRFCGAVAVSWYRSPYTLAAIDMLLAAGVRTNVHYVVGRNSIDEAIRRLRDDDFPAGVNAVIFLLHKPAGLGSRENVLTVDGPRVAELFSLIDAAYPFRVGMDSCTVPGAVRFCRGILPESLDTCEGARFSCYIGPDMVMVPCSFDQPRRHAVQLAGAAGKGPSIEAAWNGEPFEAFRARLRGACPGCVHRASCLGGCPLMPEVVLCDSDERRVV